MIINSRLDVSLVMKDFVPKGVEFDLVAERKLNLVLTKKSFERPLKAHFLLMLINHWGSERPTIERKAASL